MTTKAMTADSRFDRFRASGAIAALSVLRVGVGGIMAAHGWAKLSDVSGTALSFQHLGLPAPQILVYLAVSGEFVGGLGLLAGLRTRIAALGPACTMLVAILTVHLGHGLFAKNGGYEYPLVLLLVSAFFASNGGGPISVDAWLERGEAGRLSRAPRLRRSSMPSPPLSRH